MDTVSKYLKDERTIRNHLEDRAERSPDFLFAMYENECVSFDTLWDYVKRIGNGLAEVGIEKGNAVAVMLPNHPEHIFTMFAIATLGAVWIPLNINLRGESLAYLIEKSSPSALIVDADYWDQIEPIIADKNLEKLIIRNSIRLNLNTKALDFNEIVSKDNSPPDATPTLDDLRCVSFTSGTTGPPKGALLTERMLKTCAIGAAVASDVESGDIFLLWEPIYHNSGAQMCILALMEPVSLAIVPRFSASRFWDQIRKNKVTKIHYLGGVIEILLKQPAQPNEKNHSVKIAFGAGCKKNSWQAFEKRFEVRIREAYGLTEASCFTTINTSGKVGSIGKPYPYFDLKIVDEQGNLLGCGQIGEILVREKEPGLIIEGYLNNQEATATAILNNWLHTGDLGCIDEDGDFYYMGRKKDSIRRRGENISAWEVERILNSHPKIQESAVIGVDAEIGEQEIKAFIKCAPDSELSPLDVIKWCEERMAHYQIPRYIAYIDSFDKTPTERIRKKKLSKTTTDYWDLEDSGYRIKRHQ